jgi:hypothetical protein
MAEEENKELDVEAGPVKVRTKGYRVADLLGFVAAGATCLGVYLLMEIRTEAKYANLQAVELAKAQGHIAKSEHDKLGNSIDRGTEQQEIMNYILTLNADRREALNMRMPDALRRRVIGRDP